MMRKARHLIELWQSLALGRMPTRDRFKFSHFPKLEPHLFLTNVAARIEDYRIAAAGSVVERSYGAPLKGVSFAELELGPSKDQVLEEYALCVSNRTAIASRHRMYMGEDAAVELQRVLLPFASAATGDISQVVGWCHVSPISKGGIKGAVTRWATEERALVASNP